MDGVELEMDEPFREYKHITLVENLGEEVVWVGGDKPDVQGPLKHSEDLSGTWVGVWWVLT